MKKVGMQSRTIKRQKKIKFNLSAGNLACFKSLSGLKDKQIWTTLHTDHKINSLSQPLELKNQEKIEQIFKSKNQKALNRSSFNERVVIMEYDNLDVYIDESTQKKQGKQGSKSSKKRQTRSMSQESQGTKFIEECVRVITEETDYSSTYQISPHTLTPRSNQMNYMNFPFQYQYLQQNVGRTRKSIPIEENKLFIIDEGKILSDERTTVMIKNIPNKYSQDMLLEDISINHENTFDFFYLPIDKDNHCNVGYAFLNFINSCFLKKFYEEFHMKKWKRYKSPKICNITYAKYQGTLELANHFQHTKIIHQKDRKVKPLMGLNGANKIHEIVKNQQMNKQ